MITKFGFPNVRIRSALLFAPESMASVAEADAPRILAVTSSTFLPRATSPAFRSPWSH